MTLLPSPGARRGAVRGDRRAQGAALLSDCPGPTVTALPPTPVTPKPASSSEMGTTTHPSRRARDEFTHIQHWHHAWDRGHGHRLTCLVRSILVKPFSDTATQEQDVLETLFYLKAFLVQSQACFLRRAIPPTTARVLYCSPLAHVRAHT